MTDNDLPIRVMMNITTPEQLEDWKLVEKALGPRLPKPNASGTLAACVGDRAKHIRDKRMDRLDMQALIGQVKQLVDLLQQIHGVNMAVTVQSPTNPEWDGCDNAPE